MNHPVCFFLFTHVSDLYDLSLISYQQDAVPNQPENTTEAEAEANFEFTKLECLLFAFHTVASQATEFLAENPDTLKNFKVSVFFVAMIRK